MQPSVVLDFIRQHQLAVQASVSDSRAPQAAVIGFVVSNRFEVFFDTLASSRKMLNLRRSPKIALVIGGLQPGDERTVQLEGIADEPDGEELDSLRDLYFERFPDGRERMSWPELVYVRVRPTWLRYSDYNQAPPLIVEFTADQLLIH